MRAGRAILILTLLAAAPGVAAPVADAPCRADVTGDGTVDASDVGAVLALWGHAFTGADVDRDGVVGLGDLLEVLAGWGDCPG